MTYCVPQRWCTLTAVAFTDLRRQSERKQENWVKFSQITNDFIRKNRWFYEKIQFRKDGNCTDLLDRSGTLHITIFFNIVRKVRLPQGSLFKFLVDAAALTSTIGIGACRRCWRSLSFHHSCAALNPEHRRQVNESQLFRTLTI